MNKIRNCISKALVVMTLGLGLSGLVLAGVGKSVAMSAVDAVSNVFRVHSYQTNSHKYYFYAGDMVDIDLVGDGATNLDLYVYDSYGNLCAKSTGGDDIEYVPLDVYRSEYFTIKVVNRGGDYNDYELDVEAY